MALRNTYTDLMGFYLASGAYFLKILLFMLLLRQIFMKAAQPHFALLAQASSRLSLLLKASLSYCF